MSLQEGVITATFVIDGHLMSCEITLMEIDEQGHLVVKKYTRGKRMQEENFLTGKNHALVATEGLTQSFSTSKDSIRSRHSENERTTAII